MNRLLTVAVVVVLAVILVLVAAVVVGRITGAFHPLHLFRRLLLH